MLKPLLTPGKVAEILHVSRRKVLDLPIPRVRVGDGRGKILFNEDDIQEYLKNKTEYPEEKGKHHHGGGVPKRPQKMGYRFYLHGRSWKRYAWDTQEEAKNAEAQARTELLDNPPLKTNSLGNVAALYLIDSAEQQRSGHRLTALRCNLNAFILPYFGPQTPMSTITEVEIENFIKHHIRRGVKNTTIWHYVKDIRALFYWAMEKPHKFLRVNPVVDANLDRIRNRKIVKPPLELKNFARAFLVLNQYERAWLTHECLGLRMDECNRLLRTDPNFDTEMIHIPGTKTEESECYMPMAPALQDELKAYLANRSDDSPYLFPGRSAQTKGRKIYSRRRLFEKIQRQTAFQAYMEQNPDTPAMQAWKELKEERLSGRRKAHDKRVAGLLRDTGIGAGE